MDNAREGTAQGLPLPRPDSDRVDPQLLADATRQRAADAVAKLMWGDEPPCPDDETMYHYVIADAVLESLGGVPAITRALTTQARVDDLADRVLPPSDGPLPQMAPPEYIDGFRRAIDAVRAEEPPARFCAAWTRGLFDRMLCCSLHNGHIGVHRTVSGTEFYPLAAGRAVGGFEPREAPK